MIMNMAEVLFHFSVTDGFWPEALINFPKSFDLRYTSHDGQNKIYKMYL